MTNPAEQSETDQVKVQANKPEAADLPKKVEKTESNLGKEVTLWELVALKRDGRLHCVFEDSRDGKYYLVGLVVPELSTVRFNPHHSPLSNANASSISTITRSLGIPLERIYVPGKGTASYIQALTSM